MFSTKFNRDDRASRLFFSNVYSLSNDRTIQAGRKWQIFWEKYFQPKNAFGENPAKFMLVVNIKFKGTTFSSFPYFSFFFLFLFTSFTRIDFRFLANVYQHIGTLFFFFFGKNEEIWARLERTNIFTVIKFSLVVSHTTIGEAKVSLFHPDWKR